METLRDLKEWVLADLEGRARIFDDADYYLVQYDDNPDRFVLPKDFVEAKPVIEAFAGDSLAYAKWLRKFNSDYVPRGSDIGKAITTRAAKSQCRGINRRKRNMELDAITQAIRLGRIKDSPGDKARFKLRLSRWIKEQYTGLLDAHRRQTKVGRLSVEERDELASNFWEELAQRIAGGELPDV